MEESILMGRRVLIVEDHAPMAELLADTYRFWGAEVTSASGGLAAMQWIAKQDFALVVVSWELQGMSGRELIWAIDVLAKKMPGLVIVTTGRAGLSFARRQRPGSTVVPKPFQLERLKTASWSALVRSWFARPRRQDAPRLASEGLPIILGQG